MFSLFNLQGALQSRFHNFFSLFSGLIGFPRPKQLAHYSTSFSACQELFSFFSKLFSRLFRSPRSPAKRSAIISFHPRFVNYFFLLFFFFLPPQDFLSRRLVYLITSFLLLSISFFFLFYFFSFLKYPAFFAILYYIFSAADFMKNIYYIMYILF